MPREPQPVIRRDDIKRIPNEESGLGYDVYAKPSPGGRKGWDVIREVTENPFREAHRAIQLAQKEIGNDNLREAFKAIRLAQRILADTPSYPTDPSRPGHNGYTGGPGGTPPPPGIPGPYQEPGFVPPGPYQVGGPVPPNVWGPPAEVGPQIPGMIPGPTLPGVGLVPRPVP